MSDSQTHTVSPHPEQTPSYAVPTYRPWLHRYAILTVVATFILIAIGGNVTSREVGLAVPDGFTTFGYFPITAPLEVWWNDMGTRWEHSHRLKGYIVGGLTIGLAVWFWVTQSSRPWMYCLGTGLLVLVIIQGIMGALRVSEISTAFALIHGIVAQIFLGLMVLAAGATGRVWHDYANRPTTASPVTGKLPTLAWVLLALVIGQLVLGASVRHLGAGLAIPDFPTSYGRWIPPLTAESIDAAVAAMPEDISARPSTVGQVAIHFAHRVGALVVVFTAIGLIVGIVRKAPGRGEVVGPTVALCGLLFLQVILGAVVIWKEAFPDVATAHQATGAAVLAVVVWLAIRLQLIALKDNQAMQGEVA